jgi:dihydrofolate reductase
MISIIVAASSNNAIGKDNQLLWHLPQDLKFFKNTTWAMPVIMGRKTFEAVGSKPLPGRMNIIVTRQRNVTSQFENVQYANGLPDAIQKAEATHCKEIFIAGGSEIYKQTMELADRIYLTRVHAHIEGDAFFPELNVEDWDMVRNTDFAADEKHAYSFSVQVWNRKSSFSDDE